MATPSSCASVCSRPIASALACPHCRRSVTSEGGSPTGTAITRPTSTPTTAFAPAVSSPQHPSPSEPLEGIPAGAPEGSKPEGPDPLRSSAIPAGKACTEPASARSAQHRPTAPRPQTWVAWWAFTERAGGECDGRGAGAIGLVQFGDMPRASN
jgi:hypothetical protein